MTPPFMAQGMNQGLRDVVNLAWKISSVARGKSTERLLDTYQAERRPNVRQVINVTKELGRVICERDFELAAERDRRMKAEVAAGQGSFVRQGLLPPIADGLIARGPEGAPLTGAGEVSPQPWVLRGRERRRLDDLIGTGLRLFAAATAELTTEIRENARVVGASIIRIGVDQFAAGDDEIGVVEEGGVMADWMKAHSCDAYLARPDHIVFGAVNGSLALANLLSDWRAGTSAN